MIFWCMNWLFTFHMTYLILCMTHGDWEFRL